MPQIERRSIIPSNEDEKSKETLEDLGLGVARRSGCTVFLAYTSNMISAGVREVIRFLVQHNLVSCSPFTSLVVLIWHLAVISNFHKIYSGKEARIFDALQKVY